MRTVIILALLLLTQAYAAEPYPEHAGAKFPVEHWRLQLVERPCGVQCLDSMTRTVPGFESYSRSSCIRKGIETMEDARGADRFGGISPLVGFTCVFIREDD
jgi:hypothetical protein